MSSGMSSYALSYMVLYHPKLVLPRYGNSSTRYVDRRDPVKSHPVGKQQDKNNTSAGRGCDRSKIDTVTIHIMELARNSDETRFDGVNAHFAVLRSGTVLHLHDESEYLFASHDFNCRSIAVEFEGNYPYKQQKNGQYLWWSDTYPTPRSKQTTLTSSRKTVNTYGGATPTPLLVPSRMAPRSIKSSPAVPW